MTLTTTTERAYCQRCDKHKEVLRFAEDTSKYVSLYICVKCLEEIVKEFK